MQAPAPVSALITAGTTGTGLAIALKLARPGMKLFLNYLDDDAVAKEAADEVAAKGADVILIKADVGSPDACRRIIARVAEETTSLNIIVHSAATPNPGDLIDQNIEQIHHALDVGAMAVLYLLQPAMDLMAEDSSVLFLSGAVATWAIPDHGAIGIAKAVGECMIRYLAVECAARKINFNTLRFGPIDSPLFRTAYSGKQTPSSTPYGRRLEWDDISSAAAFLLSPEAVMIRGQGIMVDGGLSTTVVRPG